MTDFIQGQKFWEIADHIFSPDIENVDYNRLENKMSNIQNGDIIYTHTMYAKILDEWISKQSKEVIVVSHNADEPMDFNPCNKVLRWFSQNVTVIDNRVTPIPIGLQNNKWLKEVPKLEIIDVNRKTYPQKNRLLYINHSTRTNPKERRWAYDVLAKEDWVDAEQPHDDFIRYAGMIMSHSFVLCPPGNGIDTHRTWETLYLNSIPIIKQSVRDDLYSGLPVVKIKDWDVLLNKDVRTILTMIDVDDLKYDKLNFKYWRDLIWDSKKK